MSSNSVFFLFLPEISNTVYREMLDDNFVQFS